MLDQDILETSKKTEQMRRRPSFGSEDYKEEYGSTVEVVQHVMREALHESDISGEASRAGLDQVPGQLVENTAGELWRRARRGVSGGGHGGGGGHGQAG